MAVMITGALVVVCLVVVVVLCVVVVVVVGLCVVVVVVVVLGVRVVVVPIVGVVEGLSELEKDLTGFHVKGVMDARLGRFVVDVARSITIG